MESTPKQERDMLDNEMIEKARSRIIKVLEDSLKLYTHDYTQSWEGEEIYKEIIEKVRNKVPFEFAGVAFEEAVWEGIDLGAGIPHGDPRRDELFKVFRK